MAYRFTKFQYRNKKFQVISQHPLLLWPSLFLKSASLPRRGIADALSKKIPFVKVLVIRGIGYRGFHTVNDLLAIFPFSVADYYKKIYSEENELAIDLGAEMLDGVTRYEIVCPFYLTLRAGHTEDSNWGAFLGIKNGKKNRKVVLSSKQKSYVNYIANCAWLYRRPSVYTGRGVRRKKIWMVRKKGKRDQKGRGF